jgi:hypothetical protein
MSIFKETFSEPVSSQIGIRQDLLVSRNQQEISYLTSRKAWARLTSGVNTSTTDEDGPSSTLARNYILQGGALYNSKFRNGIGKEAENAYSTFTPSGEEHRLGLRPMPGITNIDIKSKSAYGSLREATINFVCWDIRQLEDLEILYMRPGFTALLEWGWSPYINNKKSSVYSVETYDKFINGTCPVGDNSLQEIYKELYGLSQKQSGNYDALIGYIKNFQWSFRPDGGYDCSTTLISFGEVLESLKINYALPDVSNNEKIEGFLGIPKNDFSQFYPSVYNKSKLAGLLYELASYMATDLSKPNQNLVGDNGQVYSGEFDNEFYDLFALDIKTEDEPSNTSDKNKIISLPKSTKYQYYITLESLCTLLNKYILVTTEKGKLAGLSTLDRKFNVPTTATASATPPPPPTQYVLTPQPLPDQPIGSTPFSFTAIQQQTVQKAIATQQRKSPITGSALLCLTHPLQLSVDPTVCLINSPTWKNGFLLPKIDENIDANTSGVYKESIGDRSYSSDAIKIVQKIIDYGLDKTGPNPYADIKNYLTAAKNTTAALQELIAQYEIKRGAKVLMKTREFSYGAGIISSKGTPQITENNTGQNSIIRIGGYLSFKAFSEAAGIKIGDLIKEVSNKDNTLEGNLNSNLENEATNIAQTTEDIKRINEASDKASKASTSNLKFLNKLSPFFKDNNENSGLGYISNIYVSINYLFGLISNQNLESLDKKEKNEINVYDFLKTVMSAVQSSIGNINNFDIHVDPNDNIGRIIDINFTNENPADDYEKATVIQIQGLKSTAKNVSLQSQIFPEQSSIVAISAQNGGGTIGLDNNTLVGFNRGIEDRILPKKYIPGQATQPTAQTRILAIGESIGSLAKYIMDLKSLVTGYLSDNIHATYNSSNSGEYKNSLKDIIIAIKSICDDPNQFKSIIPTKLSITMDGIGGLVIGNLFRIPEDSLPRGYKGGKIGRKLGYIVTGISHKIDTSFWETTIDSQTVILEANEKSPNKIDYSKIIIPDPSNPDGKMLKLPDPVVTSNVGQNSYENSPVATYYRSRNRRNGYIPNSELRNLNTDDKTSNAIHKLHPTAASKWEALVVAARAAGYSISKFNISHIPEAAYRTYAQQSSGVGRATPGFSPHGWGGAVDIQQLVTAQKIAAGLPVTAKAGRAAGAVPAAKVRETNNLYKWLATNGPTYGWYNPYRLADNSGTDECWHFEYWGEV